MMDRLRADLDKMHGHPRAARPRRTGPASWSPHPYMGPVPAFFYAAGQLMDYGVHSWDIRAGHRAGRTACPATRPTCWCRSCSSIWQWHGPGRRGDRARSPSASGSPAATRGDYRVSLGEQGMTYEPGEIDDLPAVIEFDAGAWC